MVKKSSKSGSTRSSFSSALKEQMQQDAPVVQKRPKGKVALKKAPHLIVQAKAGTGKTTTIVNGLALLCNDEPAIKTPSSQQKAIWDVMTQEIPVDIRICAFNKAIETELTSRIPWACCETRTCHSFGYKFLRDGDSRCKFAKIEKWKTTNILEHVTGYDYADFKKQGIPANQIDELVKLAKFNFLKPDDAYLIEAFDQLLTQYGIECNGSIDKVLEWSAVVLKESMEFRKSAKGFWHMPEVDFADMIWLPLVLGVEIPQAALVLVDEAQDLNPCQQELVLRMGSRVVMVGDNNQAIYGFAGADCHSMSNMRKRLEQSDRGVVELPLNITYRCGKKIVEKAQTIVPDYEAYEGNPEGEVREIKDIDLPRELDSGDMVICRINAPLVSMFFKLLGLHKKARIQGRDIGQGLISLIDKQKATSLEQLAEKLTTWHEKEMTKLQAKKFPSEGAMINLNDKLSCLMQFVDTADSVQHVRDTIAAIFTDEDEKGAKKPVLLTSAHRSKGLEAQRAYILKPEKMPHPLAKTQEAKQQEYNLQYVSWTRAISSLVFVKSTDAEKQY